MKRVITVLIPLVLLAGAGLIRLAGEVDPPTQPVAPVGIIAGQAVGRVNLDANLNTEVLMYFPAIEGIGTHLFNTTYSDESESVRNAFFTARSNKFSGSALVNSSVGILLLAKNSERIVMNVYFNPNPDRDFSKPETFSDGQLVGVYPVSAGSTTLVGGANASFAYSAQLESSGDFVFRGQTYNGQNLLPAFSVFLNGAAPSSLTALTSQSGFTIPMAGVMIMADKTRQGKVGGSNSAYVAR
ncbi:MAG: hypothetical protein HYX27_14890 [Acidobacteria bacterium]|nr:hypothetical protein [Acidobacteriota bacterium]